MKVNLGYFACGALLITWTRITVSSRYWEVWIALVLLGAGMITQTSYDRRPLKVAMYVAGALSGIAMLYLAGNLGWGILG